MTSRVIRESYDGGKVEVGDGCPFVGCSGDDGRVIVAATERGMATAVLHLTPAEARELAVALNVVADDRGAGVEPTCQCEHEAHFGNDQAAIHAYCEAPAGQQRADYVGPVCDPCATAHVREYLIQSPAAEPGCTTDAEDNGAERCAHGYLPSDCPDFGCPFTHQSPATAPTIADILASARAELLANSTPVERVSPTTSAVQAATRVDSTRPPGCTNRDLGICSHPHARERRNRVTSRFAAALVCEDCSAFVSQDAGGVNQPIGCGCVACFRASVAAVKA